MSANPYLEELAAVTSPAATDILYIVRDPSGTPSDKKITYLNLSSLLVAADTAEAAARAAADTALSVAYIAADAVVTSGYQAADTAEASARSTADALLAPKASPTFTGTATSPVFLATTKVTTPLIDTASGNLTLTPASGITSLTGRAWIGTSVDDIGFGTGPAFISKASGSSSGDEFLGAMYKSNNKLTGLIFSASDSTASIHSTWGTASNVDLVLGGINSSGTYRNTLTLHSTDKATFTGNLRINGSSSGYNLEIHAPSEAPLVAGFFNDTYSTTVPILTYFCRNNGSFEMGTAGAKDLRLYTNDYINTRLTIYGSSGTLQSNVAASDTVFNGSPAAAGVAFSGPSGLWAIRGGTAGDFNVDVYNSGSPLNALKIAATGAGYFGTSITIGRSGTTTPLDIQADGAGSGFKVFGSNGNFIFQSGSVNGAGLISQSNTSTNGFVIGTDAAGNSAGQYLRLRTNDTDRIVISDTGAVAVGGNLAIGGATIGSNALAVTGGVDLVLLSPTGAVIEQRNGATAQSFYLYNNYTDASNYRRLEWVGNFAGTGTVGIVARGAGTGANPAVYYGTEGNASCFIRTNANNRLEITSGGDASFTASLSAATTIKPGSYTVAGLPAGVTGAVVYCSNLRVFNGAGTQQGAAAGTGGYVIYNGSNWVNADAQSVTAVA